MLKCEICRSQKVPEILRENHQLKMTLKIMQANLVAKSENSSKLALSRKDYLEERNDELSAKNEQLQKEF